MGVLVVSHTNYPKGTEYQRAKNFLGPSIYMRAHGMRNSSQILRGK